MVATVIGVATTLGFGAIQINGGLSYLTDNAIPNNMEVRTVIIVVTTALFVLSALSGLGKGIKILSNLNMILAIALLAIAIAVGPTVKIFDNMTESVGLYMQNFFEMSFEPPHLTVTNAPGLIPGPCSTGHGGFPGHPSWASSSPASPKAVQYVSLLL